MLFLLKVKSSYDIMTRYITRPEYKENIYIPRIISNKFKKHGFTERDTCLEVMNMITGLRFYPQFLVDFIENFYDYREFLSYNSHVYVINLFVSKHIHDLKTLQLTTNVFIDTILKKFVHTYHW